MKLHTISMSAVYTAFLFTCAVGVGGGGGGGTIPQVLCDSWTHCAKYHVLFLSSSLFFSFFLFFFHF
jgi:hypothetical protein